MQAFPHAVFPLYGNCYSNPSSGAQAVNLLLLLLFNCLDNMASLFRVGGGGLFGWLRLLFKIIIIMVM